MFVKCDEVSACLSEWLVLLTSAHKVLGLNATSGRLELVTVWHCIGQSFTITSLSS